MAAKAKSAQTICRLTQYQLAKKLEAFRAAYGLSSRRP